jgi:hypothetical protein
MRNLYDNGGFHWWLGVVEDRQDPQALGRCRVRVAGYHISDKTVLPTEDLPWAMPLMPMTSASVSGIGNAPVGAVEGTWVLGFFLDGEECQIPVMLGTFPGMEEPLNLTGDLATMLATQFLKPLILKDFGLSANAIPTTNYINTVTEQQNQELENSVTTQG